MIMKYSKKNEKSIIRTAIAILRKGGIIVYPTDTVYGLGCVATSKKAVSKIYRMKKRSRKLPLSILVSSRRMAGKYASISRLKTGKYTFILPSKRKLPVSKNNIGIRLPRHWCTKLPKALGKPITATSANLHGKKTPATIASIKKTFGRKVELYIDAGRLQSKASKVFLRKKRLR